jgi:hypothetical protein
MNSQANTAVKTPYHSNFLEMYADGAYCAEIQSILISTMGQHVTVMGYSPGILRVDYDMDTFHVVCIDEVQPTLAELAGERFGVERDRVFFYRSPHVVACEIAAKKDERRDLRSSINDHLKNNIEVSLPSYNLPIHVKGGYF